MPRADCNAFCAHTNKNKLQLFLASFRLQHFHMTGKIASEMHSNAFQCIAQPNATFA